MPVPQATIPNLVLKEGTDRAAIDPLKLVTTWLSNFEDAVESGDSDVVGKLFLEDSWWRDILALTWKIRAFHTEKLGGAIQEAHKAKLANIEAVTSGVLGPQVEEMGPFTLVTSAFTFETRQGSGKGYLRLGNSGPNEWKAWVVMTNLQEIRGHEELHKQRVAPNWVTSQDQEVYDAQSKKDPRVVIIGGGHSGLAIAARLKQLGVPALIVDKNGRLGDSWRLRYKNLSLHDPSWENHMPYLKFPETFPAWIPRQQIADWLEHYGSILQLPVALNSTVTSAKWDDASKAWTVGVKKDGQTTYLKPGHMILAIGYHGETPAIPDFEGMKDFKGPIIHSTKFTTASHTPDYKAKKWAVIGSSASGHDVAQDLAENGCDVTMVQRDANCVYSLNSKVHVVGAPYMKPGISLDESDTLIGSLPFPVAITMMGGATQMLYQMDKELLDRVGKTEFKFLDGSDGRGLLHLIFSKGGGHYPDQGNLELIANGTIKVRQCFDGIKQLTPKGIVLQDGREVEADAIVLATGYRPLQESLQKIVGDEVASKCSVGIFFNEDLEPAGMCSSVGHPGLWCLGGSFAMNRPGSLNLALQIKAVEVGLYPDHYST